MKGQRGDTYTIRGWRVRARAGAGGYTVLVSVSSFCCRFVCLTLLRYARRPGLGFGSGEGSAAEEMLLRWPLCFLWGFGEKGERWTKTAVGFLGSGSRLIFSLRSRPIVSVREEEERFGSFKASVDLHLGSRRSIGSGWFLSALDGDVKHWVPLSLAVVCTGRFRYHGGVSCA
ncbi:hypothetical protein Bca4012_100378 [Brassica carinata]